MEPLTARTLKQTNAETILETDSPRTFELKTLRTKRLAYFAPGNGHCQRSCIAAIGSLPPSLRVGNNPGIPDDGVGDPPKDKLENKEKEGSSVQETLNSTESVEHIIIGDTKKSHSASSEPSSAMAKSHLRNIRFPEPDHKLLEDPMVPENQKLTHILNWAQNILRKSDGYREEAKSSHMSQRACWSQSNEEVPTLRHAIHDGEQSRASLYSSWDTNEWTNADLFSSREDASHYSADISSFSYNHCSSETVRSSHTFLQTDYLTAGPIIEMEQYALTDSGGSNRGQWFSGAYETDKLEGTIPKQDHIYGGSTPSKDCKTKGTAEIHSHTTLSEFLADDVCYPVTDDVGKENNNEYFWVPLEDNSDKEDTKGGMERKQMFVRPFMKGSQLCNENCEESALSTRPAKPRKSSVKYCYSSSDLSASPLELNNVAQHNTLAVGNDKLPYYAWETTGGEFFLGNYHKISAHHSKAADPSDLPLNLQDATDCDSSHSNTYCALNFESQKDWSVIPKLDLSTLCRGTNLSHDEGTSVTAKDTGRTYIVRTLSEERKLYCDDWESDIKQYSERMENLSITNADETLLAFLSTSPKYQNQDLLLNTKGTEKTLSSENDSLQKEVNYNIVKNEVQQSPSECKVHNSPLTSTFPSVLSLFSNSSYSRDLSLPLQKQQFIKREEQPNTDCSSFSESDLVRFCPECSSGNDPNINWGMECRCVLIGVLPRQCPVSSNIAETSSLSTRKSPEKEKLGLQRKGSLGPRSEFVRSDNSCDLKCSKTFTCTSSGERELSVYENYLLYSELLKKFQNQHQVQEEQQPQDQHLVNEQGSQTDALNGYSKRHKAKENHSSSETSIFSSDLTDLRCEGKSGMGAVPLTGNIDEPCVVQSFTVVENHPRGKDYFEKPSCKETSKGPTHKAFLKQAFGTLKDEAVTSAGYRKKQETLKDVKLVRRKSIQARLKQHKRYWEKSSIAWSSYTHGEVKPRSKNITSPQSTVNCRPSSKKSLQCEDPPAGVCVVPVLNSKRTKRQPTNKPLNADTLEGTTSVYLSSDVLESCDKLTDMNPGGGDDHLLWLYLPDELWISVFSLLSHRDLCQLSQVSHRFHRLANDDTLWKIINIDNCKCLNDDWLVNIGRHQPQSLRLQRCNDGAKPITESGLRELFEQCKNSLKVQDHVVHHIVRRCPKMECLTLSSCLQVTDVSLLEISTYLSTIRHLDVSGCKKITDTGVQAIAMGCQQLQYLDLSSTAASKRGISLLSAYCNKHLTCVKLSFCKYLTEDVIKKLCKSCKQLKLLHLFGCHSIHNLKAIQDVNKLVKLYHDLSVNTLKTQGR